MKIKQLEWYLADFKCADYHISNGDWYSEDILQSNYMICKGNYKGNAEYVTYICGNIFNERGDCESEELFTSKTFDTVDEAKQAAQQHFEQFIRSCIYEYTK